MTRRWHLVMGGGTTRGPNTPTTQGVVGGALNCAVPGWKTVWGMEAPMFPLITSWVH